MERKSNSPASGHLDFIPLVVIRTNFDDDEAWDRLRAHVRRRAPASMMIDDRAYEGLAGAEVEEVVRRSWDTAPTIVVLADEVTMNGEYRLLMVPGTSGGPLYGYGEPA